MPGPHRREVTSPKLKPRLQHSTRERRTRRENRAASRTLARRFVVERRLVSPPTRAPFPRPFDRNAIHVRDTPDDRPTNRDEGTRRHWRYRPDVPYGTGHRGPRTRITGRRKVRTRITTSKPHRRSKFPLSTAITPTRRCGSSTRAPRPTELPTG